MQGPPPSPSSPNPGPQLPQARPHSIEHLLWAGVIARSPADKLPLCKRETAHRSDPRACAPRLSVADARFWLLSAPLSGPLAASQCPCGAGEAF